VGNLKSKTDRKNQTIQYVYDALYRLTHKGYPDSTGVDYVYDLAGKVQQVGDPTGTYVFAYDNMGRLTDASGKSYTWDFENRLVQAVVPGTNGGTTTFRYDPFGRRIQKSGPLGTTNYLYDGDNDIEEMDQSGNVLARYVQGNHVDEPFAELRSATISYYEENGSDAITSLTTSAGALPNTYAYDSFGKLTASNGVIVNPFQYATREFDQETNIYYYRARYYDPSLGRFISEDPIGFGGGTHFYKYAANNPVLFDDPFGLWKNTGKPAASDINTIVCNGSGGIAVQIPTDQDLSCGIGNCIWRHENQHRREALASNPSVCRNVAKGIQVDFSNDQEGKASEIAASTIEIDCLEAALKKAKCDHCKEDIQQYKKKVEDYRRYFEQN
jgi:RHS repeat-associated protein